jgi:2-methylisocitrate lyase-like PEP mutase family enzyme
LVVHGEASLRIASIALGCVPAASGGPAIEDWDTESGIYELQLALERLGVAIEAARALDFPFLVCARAENHVRGYPDLGDTIRRLQAYEAAGADVVYAPGLGTAEEIRSVCSATTKSVNVLAVLSLSFAEIAAAGAQRVSVGGAPTWVAARAAAEAAVALGQGDLSPLAARVPLDDWLV